MEFVRSWSRICLFIFTYILMSDFRFYSEFIKEGQSYILETELINPIAFKREI